MSTTTTKKTVKAVKKSATKKVTLDDVVATIARIAKANEEFQKAQMEAQKAQKAQIEAQRAQIEAQIEAQIKAQKEAQRALREDQEAQWEARKETEESLKKSLNEVHMAHKETEKTLNKALGGLSNKLGSIVENIMTPDLPNKFKQFGFTFYRIVTVKWTDNEDNPYAQIDGLLENGSQAMVVEVKTTLRRVDVDDHLKRMEKVLAYADEHDDKLQFYGAIAAMATDADTKKYALSQGFYLIEPSGEDVKVTKPTSEPKAW